MTGGQNYVLFWTLRPNLSSRLGKASSRNPSADATATAAGTPAKQSPEKEERAPASNETVSVSAPADGSSVFSSAEKVMTETFTCGVAIGNAGKPLAESLSAGADAAGVVTVAVTGTASGAFAVWENLECVKMVQAAHGAYTTVHTP